MHETMHMWKCVVNTACITPYDEQFMGVYIQAYPWYNLLH